MMIWGAYDKFSRELFYPLPVVLSGCLDDSVLLKRPVKKICHQSEVPSVHCPEDAS